MNLPIDIKQVLVCDDVRREDNGKLLIIGMYIGDILLAKFPETLKVSFWLQGINRPEVVDREVEFKVTLDELESENQHPPRLLKLAVTNSEDKDAAIGLVGIPMKIEKPTTLVLSVKSADEWVELARKGIRPMLSSVTATAS